MRRRQALRRFFRTPKGLLIIVLLILTALAAPAEGWRLVAPNLAAATHRAAPTTAPIEPASQSRIAGSRPCTQI